MNELTITAAGDVPGTGGLTRCEVRAPGGARLFFIEAPMTVALNALRKWLALVEDGGFRS